MKFCLPLFLVSVFSSLTFAGFFEISASGSYVKHTVDEINFEESKDATASISYYFWQQSAIEISYTSGLKTTNVGVLGTVSTYTNIQSESRLVGADFVLSFADKSAPFRPYIKLGAVHIHKKIIQQDGGFEAFEHPYTDGVAPSVGIGLKIALTETLSIKVGGESWTTPLSQDKVTYDYAGRAGLSWLF